MTDRPHAARTLRDALEPVIGSVYFSPECHQRYVALGFGPGRTGPDDPISKLDGPAYFCSRGSILGQVSGQVVASAFAVFNPDVVDGLVASGWALTDAATIFAERQAGAVDQLRRILGDPDDLGAVATILERAAAATAITGRPLAAGLRGAPAVSEPWDRLFRAGDYLREYRGDTHTMAWVQAGVDATEISVLSELAWGLEPKTYSRTRLWSSEQLDGAIDRLSRRGLVADGALTDRGRAFREEIEVTTDTGCTALVDALGDEFDRVVDTLRAWSRDVVAAAGYPGSARSLSPRS